MKLVAFITSIVSITFALAGVVVLTLPWTYADSFEASLAVDGFVPRWIALGCICLIGGVIGTVRNLRWYTTSN